MRGEYFVYFVVDVRLYRQQDEIDADGSCLRKEKGKGLKKEKRESEKNRH